MTNVKTGLPAAAFAGFDAGFGVLTSPLVEKSAWVDLRKWPAKIAPLDESWTRSAARSRDGRWFVLSGFPGTKRWFRVYDRAFGKGRDLALASKKPLEFGHAGFLGDRAAALPGEHGRDNRSSSIAYAPGLYVEKDGKLAPGPELPSGGADKQSGFVKLGDGADLAVFQGRIGEWKGDGFAFTFEQDLEANHNAWPMCAIPYGDDGFITISKRAIVHVRRGKPIAKLFQAKGDKYPMLLAPGGGDRIVVSMVGGALHGFDPKTKKMTALDTSSFGEDGWYAPVADAPCGIVAAIDQGAALACI